MERRGTSELPLQGLGALAVLAITAIIAGYADTQGSMEAAAVPALTLLVIAMVPLAAGWILRQHRAWSVALVLWPVLVWGLGYKAAVNVVQLGPERYVDARFALADARILGLFGLVPLRWPLGGPMEELANLFYFSYYLAVPLGLAWLWWRHGREAALRLGLALVFTFALCATGWMLWPAGGYHLTGAPASDPWGPFTALVHALYAAQPHFAAAFPSSHVAESVALVLLLRRYGAPRWAWAWASGVAFATVFGQYHFLVDAPAGWLVGLAAGHLAATTAGLDLGAVVHAPRELGQRLRREGQLRARHLDGGQLVSWLDEVRRALPAGWDRDDRGPRRG
ncbi:MAG: phosphatase PAP2 family protein [Pseudomonadota bacterium]